MAELKSAAVAFAVCFLVFLPLEKLFSYHRQRVIRKELWTDLLFFIGQYLVWTGMVVSILVALKQFIDQIPMDGFRELIANQPYWLQFIEVIFLCDFCIYWAHRFSHSNAFLWRFHRVHHTSPELDWLAAFREHPFDNVYTRVVENLPALLLGFSLETIAGFVAFRGIWGLFIHSNAKFSLGPLKYVLGSPRLHHWHHEMHSSDKVNFANLMPVMDLVFGTFHDPDTDPEEYGVPEKISHNYVVQIIQPLIPRTIMGRVLVATVLAVGGLWVLIEHASI